METNNERKFCEKCGNPISPTALYCNSCGAKLNENGTTGYDVISKIKQVVSHNKRITMIIAAVCVVFIVLLACGVGSNKSTDDKVSDDKVSENNYESSAIDNYDSYVIGKWDLYKV